MPEFKDTQSNNPLRFANSNGYDYAHVYIRFIDEVYGFEKVNQLIESSGAYMKVFGKADKELYNEWVEFLK